MSVSNDHPAAWTRVDVAQGLGMGALIAEPDGFRLEASETIIDRRERFSCRFTVRADLAWASREVRVEVMSEHGVRVSELTRTNGHWTVNGGREPALDGCMDVDVAATPLTNTLPIRRLGLRPGEYRDIAVAWIDVPDLRVRRMVQRYTRLCPVDGRERYRYGDPAHGAYELTVDRDGLVVDYQDFAHRIR